jgi:hypothetical protein
MASRASNRDFVEMIAQEVSSGIEQALRYWLGRIEVEAIDRNLTAAQRIDAIEGILKEYKFLSGLEEVGCASA